MECNKEINEDPIAATRGGEEVGLEELSFLAPYIQESLSFKGGSWKSAKGESKVFPLEKGICYFF
jgi:hypothetical protein